jgi:hypothetical protein
MFGVLLGCAFTHTFIQKKVFCWLKATCASLSYFVGLSTWGVICKLMLREVNTAEAWVEVLHIPIVCFSLLCMRVQNGRIALTSSVTVAACGIIAFILSGSVGMNELRAVETLAEYPLRGCNFSFFESPVLSTAVGVWSVVSVLPADLPSGHISLKKDFVFCNLLRSAFLFFICAMAVCVFWRRYLFLVQADTLKLEW